MAVKWNGPQIAARVRKGTLAGLVIGIGIVEQRVVQLTTQMPKTGRVYRRRGVKHQSSAPYEPFASDTGNTLAGRTIKIDAAALRATLTFRTVNAARMEFGTKKMRPRPSARRALSETADQVRDAVLGEIATELRRR